MAINQFERNGMASTAIYNQQFFVVCGPIPENNGTIMALRRFLQDHILSLSMLVAFGLFLLGSWWGTVDYLGATTLLLWRCELMAGILTCLTIFLFRTFRAWGKERVLRKARRPEQADMRGVLLCTPPPLPEAEIVSPKPEFAITIEHWKSEVPTRLSEPCIRIEELPAEFLAPDALVLNFEMRDRA